MIDPSEKSIWEEICAAEEKLRKMFRSHEGMVKRYTGPFYRSNSESADCLENHAWEWLSTVQAQILAANPRWYVETRRVDRGRVQAIAFKHALNRWTVEINLKAHLERVFTDWSFRRGVTMIRQKEVAGPDDGPLDGPYMRPEVIRLNLKRYLYDSLATEAHDKRWEGHKSIYDLDALIDQATEADGWNVKVLKLLQANQNLDAVRERPPERDLADRRRDIVLYEVFFPEMRKEGFPEEDGWNGGFITYAYSAPDDTKSRQKRMADADGELIQVREFQPYRGPKSPYIIHGQSYVPDECEPLSQFVAIEQQLRNFNIRSKVVHQAFEDYKRFMIVSGKDKKLADKIHGTIHRGVVTSQGYVKGDAESFEVGGLTDQMNKAWLFERDRLYTLSGITDALLGNVTGDATATENAIAQGGSNARIARYRNAWYDDVAEIGNAAAYMMFYSENVAIELGPEAAQEMGRASPWLIGGRQPGERFEDLEIDVEPMSMEWRNEQSDRQDAAQLIGVLQFAMAAMPQMPFAEWDGLMTDIGNLIKQPQLRERFNYQMLQQVQGLLLGGQIMALGQGSAPEPQPELAGDNPHIREALKAQVPQAPGAPAGAGKKQGLPGNSSGNKAAAGAKPKAAA